MASIYEISTWVGGTVASKNAVYFYSDKYYYSLNDANVDTPSVGGAKWGGHTSYGTANEIVPHFFWTPSYAPSINSEPTVNIVKFGDGYEQRSPENINSNLLKVSLNFDKRDEAETKAISHFLHQRGAQEAFVFTPPSPYNSMKKFVCRSWDVTMNFQNNYSISATFEEVVD
jgi:phage-related protein